jgi:hypothetical protein
VNSNSPNNKQNKYEREPNPFDALNQDIQAGWVKFDPEKQLDNNMIILYWESDLNNQIIPVQFRVVYSNDNEVKAERSMVNGVALNHELKTTIAFSKKQLSDLSFTVLVDETNDHKDWPKTIPEATEKLLKKLPSEQIEEIKKLSWSEFYSRYISMGQWIRNYFGLWRGNFTLALNCNIDEPTADNVSEAILYNFWQTLADRN